MNTLVQLLKETLMLILLIFTIGLLLKLFFRHTLIGRLLAFAVKDTILFTKWCYKTTRKTIIYCYKLSKKIHKYLCEKLEDNKKGKNNKNKSKKVVNGSNVIDFKKEKQLRHKWYK